jgi:hypothetical protein
MHRSLVALTRSLVLPVIEAASADSRVTHLCVSYAYAYTAYGGWGGGVLCVSFSVYLHAAHCSRDSCHLVHQGATAHEAEDSHETELVYARISRIGGR